MTTVSFAIDIEVSLTETELAAFKKLSELLNKDIPTLYRDCANQKCAELIKEYTENIPEE